MTWLRQSADDALAAAEVAADAVDVAATFPVVAGESCVLAGDAVDVAATFPVVAGESCAIATLMATMIPIRAPRPTSALRALPFPSRRGTPSAGDCGPGA
jgi:hypothetical protein